jgi:hypothetical protein
VSVVFDAAHVYCSGYVMSLKVTEISELKNVLMSAGEVSDAHNILAGMCKGPLW